MLKISGGLLLVFRLLVYLIVTHSLEKTLDVRSSAFGSAPNRGEGGLGEEDEEDVLDLVRLFQAQSVIRGQMGRKG